MTEQAMVGSTSAEPAGTEPAQPAPEPEKSEEGSKPSSPSKPSTPAPTDRKKVIFKITYTYNYTRYSALHIYIEFVLSEVPSSSSRNCKVLGLLLTS